MECTAGCYVRQRTTRPFHPGHTKDLACMLSLFQQDNGQRTGCHLVNIYILYSDLDFQIFTRVGLMASSPKNLQLYRLSNNFPSNGRSYRRRPEALIFQPFLIPILSFPEAAHELAVSATFMRPRNSGHSITFLQHQVSEI